MNEAPAATSASVPQNPPPCGKARFEFKSDEKSTLDDLENQVSQCITKESAEWKKLTKGYETAYHKSLRNSCLSSKYKEFLSLDPPFLCKKFRPTPTTPANPEIDAIKLVQQKSFVEKECQVMDLHAKVAQSNLKEISVKMKTLIESMSTDERVRDGIFRRWNSLKMKGEIKR